MQLKGTIDEIRFRNEENGYTIALVECDSQPVVVVGVFPPVAEGSFVLCEGVIVTHPRFGRQFKAESVRIERPDTTYGMIAFLGSGLIKGIGMKRAAAIVERFGKDTFTILEMNPERLTKISGISNRIAKGIAQSYQEHKAASDAVSFFMEYGISASLSMKVFRAYGRDAIAVVSSNPYRLIEDIDGVGFRTADKMASRLGIDKGSAFRIRAGIIYTLSQNAERNGNTLMLLDSLQSEAVQLLELEGDDEIKRNIDQLRVEHRLKVVDYDGETGIMLSGLYNAENKSAAMLCSMLCEANRAIEVSREEIEQFEQTNDISFHHHQRSAIISALTSGVSVITGGPGTGKTTIIRCIISVLKLRGLSVKLLAPTGRAAKRLNESTDEDASTIHRALGGGEVESRIIEDAVIVDEFSMVDAYLFARLLSALRAETKLIIVGDSDQLPSVGAGNVLAEIISSGIVPINRLTRIYRQDERSLITINAHKINQGQLPDLKNGGSDFFFIKAQSAEDTASKVVELVSQRLPKYLECDSSKIQVLCPMKSGEAGTVNLNKLLRASLLPNLDRSITVGENTFSAGDKVMHILNNYDMEWRRGSESGTGVFNGDMGTITDVRLDSGEIDVEFEDGRTATYFSTETDQLMLAYAITIHKSQGSEYDGVVLPVFGGHYLLMTRNLLYTAITRARRLVVLVGDEEGIKRMVKNNYVQIRYSLLSKLLASTMKKLDILYGENG